MRLHFAAAARAHRCALCVGVDRLELVALLLSIAFVLVAEMINSAIEAAIDVATSSFDPLAKLAKDIAAGAVLIASINAVAVGYLVFSGQVGEPAPTSSTGSRRAGQADDHRAHPGRHHRDRDEGATGRGTPLRGGLPSGHAAVAFAGWMAVDLGARHRAPVPRLDADVRAWRCSSHRPASKRASTRRSRSSTAALLGAIVTLVVFQLFF